MMLLSISENADDAEREGRREGNMPGEYYKFTE